MGQRHVFEFCHLDDFAGADVAICARIVQLMEEDLSRPIVNAVHICFVAVDGHVLSIHALAYAFLNCKDPKLGLGWLHERSSAFIFVHIPSPFHFHSPRTTEYFPS